MTTNEMALVSELIIN